MCPEGKTAGCEQIFPLHPPKPFASCHVACRQLQEIPMSRTLQILAILSLTLSMTSCADGRHHRHHREWQDGHYDDGYGPHGARMRGGPGGRW